MLRRFVNDFVIFTHDICIVNLDLSFEFVSVVVKSCHEMLFYGAYVRKVVGKRRESVVVI